MGYTVNSGILFKISGVALGEYIFPQNPETYELMAPKQTYTILDTLELENIYQRPLYDNDVRKMSWSTVESGTYSSLKRYAERTTSGTIPISYFWDGTVFEFQGTPVEVLDVWGVPIAGNFNQWRLEVQFKPITQYDNKKVIV